MMFLTLLLYGDIINLRGTACISLTANLQICSDLVQKCLTDNFILCAVSEISLFPQRSPTRKLLRIY